MNTAILVLLLLALVCFIVAVWTAAPSWPARSVPLGLALWVLTQIIPAFLRVFPIVVAVALIAGCAGSYETKSGSKVEFRLSPSQQDGKLIREIAHSR